MYLSDSRNSHFASFSRSGSSKIFLGVGEIFDDLAFEIFFALWAKIKIFLKIKNFNFFQKYKIIESNYTWCYYLWALGFPGILKGLWDLAFSWRFWYSNRAICKMLF
jgi:hypothetical protein